MFDVGTGANLSLGTLSGNFSFTKQGAGTLTLTNLSTRNAANSIIAGTVVVTNATALGNSTSSTTTLSDATLQIAGVALTGTKLTLNNNAALLGSNGSPSYTGSGFNPTIGAGANVRFATANSTDTLTMSTAVMGGNGNSLITISGPGTVSLTSGSSAASAYAGSWLLNGTSSTVLKLVDPNALGNPNGNNQRPIALVAGNLQLRAGTTAATFSQATTIAGSVGIIPDSTVASESNSLTMGTLSVDDGLAAVNTLTVTVGQGPGFNGSNTGSLVFGATTLRDHLTVAMNNISTGGSAIGAVTLGALDDTGSARTITKSGVGTLLLTSGATSLVNGTAVNITGGTLASNAAGALGTLANVTLSTGATLSVGANQTIGAINSAALGTGTVQLNGNTLTVGSTNHLDGVFAGTIAGSGNLAKQGGGRFTLSGTQTYTGTTNITAGQFALNGTLTSGGGSVVVGDGMTAGSGTLMGSGTIQRSVTIDKGGTLAPGGSGASGNGVGILRSNGVTMNGGGTYVVEIADASDTSNASAGAKFDQLQVTGAITLNVTTEKFIFDITSLGVGGTVGDALNFDKTKNYDWVIAKTTSGAPDFTDKFVLLDHFTNDTSGVGGSPDGGFSISGSGNDVVLHYSAAPEPGVVGVMGLMTIALLRRSRRRLLQRQASSLRR